MLSSPAAKIAILSAFQQTLSNTSSLTSHTASLTAATAMGMLIALRVSEMIEAEEFQALSEQIIKEVSRSADAGAPLDG